MRWSVWPFHVTRTFWALMVMPRSRSRSIESRYCSRMSRASTAPVSSSNRSANVDLPWSTWLMIAKLRICSRRATRLVPELGIDEADEWLAGGEAADVLGDADAEDR